MFFVGLYEDHQESLRWIVFSCPGIVHRQECGNGIRVKEVSRTRVLPGPILGWRQDNGNRSNQESKFDFLATHQYLVKFEETQQKIKTITN